MERELIDWLRERLPPHPLLKLGLGDDAAALSLASGTAVVTVDAITDGVDFSLDECDPRRIGRKALAVNLSDLAAMAAVPRAAVVALVLPRTGGLALAQQLYEGMLPLAETFDVAMAGGDTNSWNGSLVVSITAIGEPTSRGLWRRAGAKPGDSIIVTGQFGGSILGRHFDFMPRVREALFLSERFEVHAAIDVSDGLTLDLSRLAAESGCGALVELDAIPIAPDAKKLAQERADKVTPQEHALGDGEDFELILAVPEDEARRMLRDQPLAVPLTCIGQFVAERGLWRRASDGALRPVPPRGYEHQL